MNRKYLSDTYNKEFMGDVIEWDITNWWRAVSFWDNVYPMDDLSGKKVLDIGGWNGGLSLYFALKGADVICSDVNENGFDRARILHKKYHVQKRISYECIDATKIPYKSYFDNVCFKSVCGGWGRMNVMTNSRK